MFSHGGSSSAVLAHLFNLPFPYICRIFDMNYTSVTIVSLSDEQGTLTSPRLEIDNDCRHIQACENIISN
jgi:probable phosphoglycerate mutase